MYPTTNFREKYERVRRSLCFYLDIQDAALSKCVSRKMQLLGMQQEVFLTPRVTHVVGDRAPGSVPEPAPSGPGAAGRCSRRLEAGRSRADAMLERVRPDHRPPLPIAHAARHITVQKAINLLDKLYDTFFVAPRKAHVRFFTKHFIKIEFLDKPCRPVYKEFDEWPVISIDGQLKEKKEKKESPEAVLKNLRLALVQKMTRKSRPRIKEKEEPKGGYCEMCNSDYLDAALHRRSPHHLAFVRDHANFLALDSLITAGADVATFLDKALPLNGERRSLRKICNGDAEPKRRAKRSQSPDSTLNGDQSPKRNGALDDERKHNTRCSKKSLNDTDDRQYYKVVGVSTKLRSSGGFASKRKDSPPTCNGTKPLVVKFRKVRRSELSVLSDEAEQFMFPKRASSTSSTSSSDDEKALSPKRKTPPVPPTERRRLARPLALKEESSEEDGWPEDARRRKRKAPARAARAPRRAAPRAAEPAPEPPPEPAPEPAPPASPLREEPAERCMKWEDGRLKYTPAVEQLEFAFESVPRSEPWFETFERQDRDRVLVKNVPQYFALYSQSPKLPYEIGQLPPLKPNCCPLSDLVKREDKPGPSRSYGTRGMKKQKIRKRTAAVIALEGHPRKSPREHASTLAILGSAGLLHRRKHADDTKSTASEDTISDTHSNVKLEPVVSETQQASDRLQQFLSEVFDDAAEYDLSEEVMEGEAAVTTSTNVPDVSSLMSECEGCDLIRNEIGAVDRTKSRRGKFKKKNRTGWPNKKKQVKKSSRANSSELEKDASLDRSSAEPPDDETTQDTISEDENASGSDKDDKTILDDGDETRDGDDTLVEDDGKTDDDEAMDVDTPAASRIEEKVKSTAAVEKEKSKDAKSSSDHEERERELRKKKRALQGLGAGAWLQPVVRVARVDPAAARRLRSAAAPRSRRCR